MSGDKRFKIFSNKCFLEGGIVKQYGIEFVFNGKVCRISEISENVEFVSEIATLLESSDIAGEHVKDIIEDSIVKKFTL